MSRWRPPGEKRSPYITPIGASALKSEFEQLWRVRRPAVVAALSAAAAEGDRSENAEYIYRKKELREIDARLKYLTQRLESMRVVSDQPEDTESIRFAARVEADDEDSQKRHFTLVSADEIELIEHGISIDAPIARALLGKRVGDIVDVKTPAGTYELEVITVSYPSHEDEVK